ncbi:MAG: carbon-nitrogen hydrolase family protein [Bacteroidota bacterium]
MNVKVGVVQAKPVFFNKRATIQKMKSWIRQLAGEGCQLIVFPESFIPGYPRGFDFGTIVGSRTPEGRELYREYLENAIEVPGPEVRFFESLCRSLGIYLVMGVTEKQQGTGSLFCTMLYFGPKGYIGKHQKLKPTGQERVLWSEGQRDTLIAVNSQIGILGGLICWENYMPPARLSMYQAGVQIYIAPTADARPSWIATMQHIACEGRCFVIGSNQYIQYGDYPEPFKALIQEPARSNSAGGSVIIAPTGELIIGPLWHEQAGLIATLDLRQTWSSKLDFDVIGHYSRSDLFPIPEHWKALVLEE